MLTILDPLLFHVCIEKREVTAPSILLQGRRNLFYGGGWVKMSPTMVDRRRKTLKLHWLKRSKTVQKKENLDQKQMIQNLIFVVYLLILLKTPHSFYAAQPKTLLTW